MEIRAHYVAVGAFVLLMVALAFVTVLWLARGELRTEYARYDIYFSGPVTGLRQGSIVEYRVADDAIAAGRRGGIGIVYHAYVLRDKRAVGIECHVRHAEISARHNFSRQCGVAQ